MLSVPKNKSLDFMETAFKFAVVMNAIQINQRSYLGSKLNGSALCFYLAGYFAINNRKQVDVEFIKNACLKTLPVHCTVH